MLSKQYKKQPTIWQPQNKHNDQQTHTNLDVIVSIQTLTDIANHKLLYCYRKQIYKTLSMNQQPNEYDRFESDLHHILQDHEVPFNPDDWTLMEEQLRRKNGGVAFFLQKHKWLIVAGFALLIAAWQLKNRLNTPDISFVKQQQTAPAVLPTHLQNDSDSNPIAPANVVNKPKHDPTLPASEPIKTSTEQPNNANVEQNNMPTALNDNEATNSSFKTDKKLWGKAKQHSANNKAMPNNDNAIKANSQAQKSLNLHDDIVKTDPKPSMVSNEYIAHKSRTINANSNQQVSAKDKTGGFLTPNAGILNNATPPNPDKALLQTTNNAISSKDMDNEGNKANQKTLATEINTTTTEAPKTNDAKNEMELSPPETKEIAETTTPTKKIATKKPKKKFTAFYAMPTASIDGNFINGRPLRLGHSAGLTLNYQFHRLFSVEAGVSYTQKNYQATTFLDNSQPTYPEQYRLETAKMSFIEVPLIFKFHLPAYTDECLPYIGIGNSILMPIEKQYTYSLIDPPAIFIEGISDSTYLNAAMPQGTDNNRATIWKNINLKAGASFKLSKKLRLNIESQFKSSLDAIAFGATNPVIEKSGEKYNLYSFGIQGGLSYRF